MSKQVKKVPLDKEREYEWLIISQSYLQCALMNARILREKLNKFASCIDDSPMDLCLKNIYGDYPQSTKKYLVFPIIFSFKHGIEIYLKAIAGMQNSEFSKRHNLVNLMKEAKIKDKSIKDIIKKYAFGHLLLPRNRKNDIDNIFERYPQGSPYDKLSLFIHVNIKTGEIIKCPKYKKSENYLKWLNKNNNTIRAKSIITQEKIDELIKDIEFVHKNLREISISVAKKF